jgi:hypothetical protein
MTALGRVPPVAYRPRSVAANVSEPAKAVSADALVSVSYLIPLRPLPAGDGAGSPCPKADLAGATERAAQAAREGNSPEGRPLTTRAAISATGITWAVDIASMTRVA